MNDVIKLVPIIKQAQQETVEILEELLVLAKDGHINSIAIAYVTYDDAVNTRRSATDRFGSLLGAVSLLQHRLLMDV